jgi:hypothetical protein
MKRSFIRHSGSGVLIRPTVRSGECRQSYLMRVAQENGMKGIQELCRSLRTTYSALVACPDEWVAATLTGVRIPKSILKPLMGKSYYICGLSTRSRVCPSCVQENFPVPPEQNFSLAIRCIRHSTMLVDECPDCAKPLSYMRREAAMCDCGYALSKAPAIPSEPWVNTFCSIFSPWRLGSDFDAEEQWSANEFRSASVLSVLLKQAGAEMECLWLRSKDWTAVSSLACTWHTRGRDVLLEIWESKDRKPRNRINFNLKQLDTPLLRSAVRDTGKRICEAAKARYRSKTLANLFPEMVANEELGTPSEIRKLAKLDADAMRALLDSGLLGRVAEASDGRVVFRRFSAGRLSQLKALWANALPLGDAATQIGCDKFLLLDLAHYGMVNAHLLEVKPRTPRFNMHDLNHFLAGLRDRTRPLGRGQAEYVLLEVFSARKGKGHREKLWEKVLPRIKNRTLPLYSVPFSWKRSYWQVGVLVGDLRRLGTSQKVLADLIQRTHERHLSCS